MCRPWKDRPAPSNAAAAGCPAAGFSASSRQEEDPRHDAYPSRSRCPRQRDGNDGPASPPAGHRRRETRRRRAATSHPGGEGPHRRRRERSVRPQQQHQVHSMGRADPASFDAIVLLDTQPQFAFSPLPPGRKPTAVIDHHRTGRGRKAECAFCDVRTDVGATSSIVFSYFMELESPDQAGSGGDAALRDRIRPGRRRGHAGRAGQHRPLQPHADWPTRASCTRCGSRRPAAELLRRLLRGAGQRRATGKRGDQPPARRSSRWSSRR